MAKQITLPYFQSTTKRLGNWKASDGRIELRERRENAELHNGCCPALSQMLGRTSFL